MAKINNAQIIQKLIDELKLYPGTDVIPTELAEKILPVFQVNDQEVIVSVPKSNVVRFGAATGGTPATIFTVATTGRFFLTNAQLTAFNATVSQDRNAHILITIKDDATPRQICIVRLGTDATASEAHGVAAMNFQNPIELEPGSNIDIDPNLAGINASGCIVGYTQEI